MGLIHERHNLPSFASQYYTMSAQQGHPRSQFNLALLPTTDPAQSKHLLQTLVLHKSSVQAKALVALGDLTLPTDAVEAAALYQLSATLHYAVGQFRFGTCLIQGIGVDKNVVLGLHQCTLACRQNLSAAEVYLGTLHAHGKGGALSVNQGDRSAVHWWTKAAQHGHPNGQYLLGKAILHRRGGLIRNEDRATRLFASSALQNHTKAQCELGTCYYHGIGTAQNYRKAAEWYTQAAHKGNKRARECLNVMHALGLDCPLHFPVHLRNYVREEFALKC